MTALSTAPQPVLIDHPLNSLGWAHKAYKRNLSVYEKTQVREWFGGGELMSEPHRFLVLPGGPDTEVDEIFEHVTSDALITGIEEDQRTADTLYEHYFDRIQMHWLPMVQFLERSQQKFNYFHLDFCGHFTEKEQHCLALLPSVSSGKTWVRMSVLRNRKREINHESEEMIRRMVVRPLMQYFCGEPANPNPATTELILVSAVCSYTFGKSVLEMADTLAHYGWSNISDAVAGLLLEQSEMHGGIQCPDPNTFSQMFYHEPGHPSAMETAWGGFLHHDSWNVDHVLDNLSTTFTRINQQPFDWNVATTPTSESS